MIRRHLAVVRRGHPIVLLSGQGRVPVAATGIVCRSKAEAGRLRYFEAWRSMQTKDNPI